MGQFFDFRTAGSDETKVVLDVYTHTAGPNDSHKRGDGMDEEDYEFAHTQYYQLLNPMNFNVFWISPGTGSPVNPIAMF